MFNFFQFVIVFLPSIIVKAPRALPPLPTVSVDLEGSGKSKRSKEGKNASAATISSPASCNNVFLAPKLVRSSLQDLAYDPCPQVLTCGFFIFICSCACSYCILWKKTYFLQDRLTARERRRMKKSQEISTETGGCCHIKLLYRSHWLAIVEIMCVVFIEGFNFNS